MPLQRRVPKFGFKNINRKEYQGVNLDTLQQLVDDKKIKDTVDIDTLIDLRLGQWLPNCFATHDGTLLTWVPGPDNAGVVWVCCFEVALVDVVRCERWCAHEELAVEPDLVIL